MILATMRARSRLLKPALLPSQQGHRALARGGTVRALKLSGDDSSSWRYASDAHEAEASRFPTATRGIGATAVLARTRRAHYLAARRSCGPQHGNVSKSETPSLRLRDAVSRPHSQSFGGCRTSTRPSLIVWIPQLHRDPVLCAGDNFMASLAKWMTGSLSLCSSRRV